PGSRLVKVTCTLKKKNHVTDVATAASKEGLIHLVAPGVDAADRQVRDARVAVDSASRAVEAYRTTSGVAAPDDDDRAANTVLANDQVALTAAQSSSQPDPVRIAGLKNAVTQAQARVKQLAKVVVQAHLLQNVLDRANQTLALATQNRSQAVAL